VHGPRRKTFAAGTSKNAISLMPYLYTAVEEMSRTGLPVLRHCFSNFPRRLRTAIRSTSTPETNFLFGSDLLVRPPPRFLTSWTPYPVHFPSAGLVRLWTGERLEVQEWEGGG